MEPRKVFSSRRFGWLDRRLENHLDMLTRQIITKQFKLNYAKQVRRDQLTSTFQFLVCHCGFIFRQNEVLVTSNKARILEA